MQRMLIAALFGAYIAAIAPLAQADIADMASAALAQPALSLEHFVTLTFDALVN